MCQYCLLMKLLNYASVDVNGAKNLVSRAYWVSGPNLHSTGKALVRQVEEFLKNLSGEQCECLRSKARGLLAQNSYFGVLGDSPKPDAWTNVYK